jgi:RNA-directed DNA polymerase
MRRHRESQGDAAQSMTPCMSGYSTRENRETSGAPLWDDLRGPGGEGVSLTTAMHAPEESDEGVVPTNALNNDGGIASAEEREGRPSTEKNPEQSASPRTQSRSGAPGGSSGLFGVREAAQRDPRLRFTALLHHVTVARLRESFFALKRDAAPGVDGVTWTAYGTHLDTRLAQLHARVHRGAYRARPSKRAYIPKADGRQRPLGIAALEDKLVQHALGMVLQAIYEVDFLGFSYGFRPGRSQHQALDALMAGLMRQRVNWVLDADIQGFFDTLDQHWLLRFVEHRIADPRVLRLIGQWLRAGVLEAGVWTKSEQGTPQGAVLSPLLANLYLHYVFDRWVQQWRTHHATGDVIVVRYADDIVMGFQHRHEAEQCLAAWQARLATYGLRLHPEKTRLIEFGRFAIERRLRRGAGKPEPFDFLGFTHFCGRTRTGQHTVRRQSITKRLRAKLQEVKATLRQRMHEPVAVVGAWLRRVVSGWFGYHAVPGNARQLEAFRRQVLGLWYRRLRRRSQRRSLTWERFTRRFARWLPSVRILHPCPVARFAVRHSR